MDNYFISIIIPCYNSDFILHKTLNSVLNQEYKNWECIIINDGSTDNSKKIIEEFCKLDDRFFLIDQTNSGVAEARNKGLNHAKGDYIFFLDADDFLPENSLMELTKYIKYDTDVIVGKIQILNFNNNKEMGVLRHNLETHKILKNKDLSLLLGIIEKGFSPVVMNKLYKRDFILNNSLSFNKELLHEDELWQFEVFSKVKNLFSTDSITYFHYDNINSSITNNRGEKNINDLLKILEIIYQYYLNEKEVKKKETISAYLLYFKLIVILSFNLSNKRDQKKLKRKVIDTFKKNISERNRILFNESVESFYRSFFILTFTNTSLINFFLKNENKNNYWVKKYLTIILKISYLINRKTIHRFYKI